MRSPSGHSAAELAQFWNHFSCYSLLSKTSTQHADCPSQPQSGMFFSSGPLDRAAHIRKQTDNIKQLLYQPETKFIVLHKLSPLVNSSRKTSSGKKGKYSLWTGNIESVAQIFDKTYTTLIQNAAFLGFKQGIDCPDKPDEAWFALDVSYILKEQIKTISPDIQVLLAWPGLLQLSPPEAAICGQARSLLDWNARYKFCPSCGSKTNMADAGYKKICPNERCISNKGHIYLLIFIIIKTD